jgi:predicted transcriptional regulator
MKNKIFEVIKLSNKPLKVGDLEKLTNIDRNTVQKILNELHLEGKIRLDKCYNKVLGLNQEGNNNE